MPKPTLATRICSDPAYLELVRLVGYLGVRYPIADEIIEPLNAKYGKAAIIAASAELVECDATGKLAVLKPGVKRLCRGVLGPTPDEWDEFYAGVENPPPNPYKSETGEPKPSFAKSRKPKSRPQIDRPATNATELPEDVRDLEGVELMRRYFAARRALEENDEHSAEFQRGKPEYDRLRAECLRRDINLPPTGYDDPAFQFSKHTTHRLHELLDMNQYDLTRYDPESVTYHEAARDIGFIEAELRRRRPGGAQKAVVSKDR